MNNFQLWPQSEAQKVSYEVEENEANTLKETKEKVGKREK